MKIVIAEPLGVEQDLLLNMAREALGAQAEIMYYDTRITDTAGLIERGKDCLLYTSGAGFPADYMEPSYDCPDCHDTGFIGNSKCHCFKQAVIDMLYTQSNLKEILQSENFSHFTYEFYDDRVKDPSTGRTALELSLIHL